MRILVIPAAVAVLLVILYRRQKIEKVMFLIVLAGLFFCGIVVIREGLQGEYVTVTALERTDTSQTISLQAQTEEGEEIPVILTVPGKRYSHQEAQERLESLAANLDQLILGENESLTNIRYSLKLENNYTEAGIRAEWSTDRPMVLNWDGSLGSNNIESGTDVTLEAVLMLQEETYVYSRVVRVYRAALEETDSSKLTEETKKLNENQTGSEYKLPDQFHGKNIFWKQKRNQVGANLSVLCLLGLLLAVLNKKKKTDQAVKKRKEQLTQEYPDLVSKIQMFLAAGLTMKKIMERLGREGKNGRGPAYEEIARAFYEMETGVSEEDAYEHFANRCDLPAYRGLVMLLNQNLKKGSKGLSELLETEARTAQQERKRRARAAGETAAVKLLLPMGMMLAVVLILILVPAMTSM